MTNNNNVNNDICMKKLIEFFKKIKIHSEKIGNGNNGKEFENKIMNLLVDGCNFRRKQWYSEDEIDAIKINDEKERQKIQDNILQKDFLEPIVNNTNEKGIFIYQPFGSQNYPDFLIFTEKYIIPLEIKFSNKDNKSSLKPKWNSNIPKANGFYIFAIAGKQATFFLGSDFIDDETRRMLLDYFNNIPEDNLEVIKNKMIEFSTNNKKSNPFGLKPYVRKDYTYDKEYSTDKESFKKTIFQYSKENNWENNLIKCLEDLAIDGGNE